jgi:glutamyl-tRNA reductase
VALDAFGSRGARAITVTGRTYEKARELAEKSNGSVLGFDSFPDSLHLFDVVLCSTSGKDPILTREAVRKAIAKHPSRPLFLIDVSMPRDVEQSVGDLESVYLYNLDDVSAIANENLKSRQAEVAKCREALEKKAGLIWNQLLFSSNPPA